MTTDLLPKRVCAYYRVSTGKQAEADLSIPDQRHQIREFCRTRAWTIEAEFVEPGASAMDDNRPQFLAMIERACDSERPFDVILVHSFSRFFRDLFLMEMYLRKLKKAGVELISITQIMGNEPGAQMLRQILSMFDEYQSKETSKHVLRAMKENARQGFYNGTCCPLGYKAEVVETRGNRAKKKLVVDVVEAEVVKLMFKLYLIGDGKSGPLGLKNLVKWLNERGYRTRKGARFGVGTVHWILTNPVYVGSYMYNTRSQKTGLAKPPSEHITVRVPAIIDQKEFDSVQKVLSARNPRTTAPRVVTGPTLLTGLARCMLCDGAMTLRTGTSRSGRIYKYYSCATRARQGEAGCGGQSIPMEKLDGLVVDHLNKRLFEPVHLAALLSSITARQRRNAAEVDKRIANLRAELESNEQKLDRLYHLVATDGAEVDDIFKGRVTNLREERNRIKGTLERLSPAPSPPLDWDRSSLEQFSATMRENLTKGSISFRKAYIGAIVERIEVGPNVVRIVGAKRMIEQAVRKQGMIPPGVRSFERKWRTGQDSNPRPPDS